MISIIEHYARRSVPVRRPVAGAVAVGLAQLLVAFLPASARAQQDGDGAAADPLDQVRELVALRDTDLGVIDVWISALVEELKQPDQEDLNAAATKFVAAFAGQRSNAANSPAFTGQLAARAGAAFAPEFRQAEPLPQAVVWPMGRVLLDLSGLETRDALAAGLAHPDQALRYLCAETYANLRSQIAADRSLARDTIAMLRDTAIRESNSVVLGALYKALAFNDDDQLQDVVLALAAVFEARVRQRQSGEVAAADRAELRVWEFLKQIRSRIPEAAKAPLVRPLAALLVLDVDRYQVAVADEKSTIEERIEVGEGLLEDIVGRSAGGGNIRKPMKTGDTAADLDMKLELYNWVGAEGQVGKLNEAPWNVPVGGLPAAP